MTNAQMLKGAIVEAGYTQARLAEKLDMSVNTLSSKISGFVKNKKGGYANGTF